MFGSLFQEGIVGRKKEQFTYNSSLVIFWAAGMCSVVHLLYTHLQHNIYFPKSEHIVK